jgi:hypothetical protein
MASITSSYFTTPALTSQLEAPTEIQQSIDFPSDRTTASIREITSNSNYDEIDWSRLRGFEMPPPKQKRQRAPKSHVWTYGWRLYKPREGREYWVCKLCHLSPNKPAKPIDFAYVCTRSTTSAIEHLRLRHRLGQHGPIAVEAYQPSTQSSIDGYYAAAAERNSAALAFDYNVFRSLLIRMFTEEQLPLAKIEAPAVRDVLTYLQPRCKAAIPSRTTLRRCIASAYDEVLGTVVLELASASTKVTISFDLWTSLGRRLLLLGVVAHYLNHNFEPQAILLPAIVCLFVCLFDSIRLFTVTI